MLGERFLGADASYLSRLGALCALLCGVCALLGAALLAVSRSAGDAVALVVCASVALAGLALVHRS